MFPFNGLRFNVYGKLKNIIPSIQKLEQFCVAGLVLWDLPQKRLPYFGVSGKITMVFIMPVTGFCGDCIGPGVAAQAPFNV